MLKKEQVEHLTDDQIIQLDNALETFNCRAVLCNLCPLNLGGSVSYRENHSTSCLCVYIAARALEIKSKSIT